MHCRVLFNFDGPTVNAFGESWTFDPHYSEHLLADFDADHDGAFSPSEVAEIAKVGLPNLAGHHYLTFVTVDGQDVGELAPYTFNAVARDGIVTFAFSMKLPTPVDPSVSDLRVEISDPAFTIYPVFPEANPVALRGAGDRTCTTALIDNAETETQAATVTCD